MGYLGRNCVGEVLGSKMVVNNCVQTLFAVEALECLQAVLTGLGLGLRQNRSRKENVTVHVVAKGGLQRNELAYLDGRVSRLTSLQWNKTEEYYIYR
ncbi:hypothetical protein Gohar_015951, partial [Gossypium harknessii]|nr:hypothetical protein [Gossypium harknessii]